MEVFFGISLAVVIGLCCLLIAVYEKLLKQKNERLKSAKSRNKIIGELSCMLADSHRFIMNIERLLEEGNVDQAEALKDFFMNIVAPKYIDDRDPYNFRFVANMFDALASKMIFSKKNVKTATKNS